MINDRKNNQEFRFYFLNLEKDLIGIKYIISKLKKMLELANIVQCFW